MFCTFHAVIYLSAGTKLDFCCKLLVPLSGYIPFTLQIKGIISEYERENQLEYERTQANMIALETNLDTLPHSGATPTTPIEENQTSEADEILTPVETSSLVHSISMVESPLSPNFEENDSVLSLPE